MDIAIDDGRATITLPPGINYDRRWLLWRGRIIHEGFELIRDYQKSRWSRPSNGRKRKRNK